MAVLLRREYLKQQRLERERMEMEAARARAAEEAQAAARRLAREKIEDVLAQDAHDLLAESMDQAHFDQLWREVLAAMAPDIQALLLKLEAGKFKLELSALEGMLRELRAKEVEKIVEAYRAITKETIAQQILQGVRQSIPDFNEAVAAAMAKNSAQLASQLKTVTDRETSRRAAEVANALRELAAAKEKVAAAESAARELAAGKKTARPLLNRALEEADRRLAAAAQRGAAAGLPDAASNLLAAAREARSCAPAAETGTATNAPEIPAQGLAELGGRLAREEKAIVAATNRFAIEARRAAANLVASNSHTRAAALAFAENALRTSVAESYRKRTEDLARQALVQHQYAPDEIFVQAVGQRAVELLLGKEADLPQRTFDELTADFKKLMGLAPMAGEEGETAGPEGAGEGPDPYLLFNKQLAETFDQADSQMIDNAFHFGIAKSMAALPKAKDLGEETPLGLRVSGASTGLERTAERGPVNQRTLIGLGDTLDQISEMIKPGGSQHIYLFGGGQDLAAYRRHVQEVVANRKLDETPLVAGAIKDATSAAQGQFAAERIGVILVNTNLDDRARKPPAAAAAKRVLVRPTFPAFAFGGAPMADPPPAIDGDLGDWAEVADFTLEGVVKKDLWPGPLPPAWEGNRRLMTQWDHTGFYFAYRMVNEHPVTINDQELFWLNDSLELFFDFQNLRADVRSPQESRQFWFWPLGSALGPEILGGECEMRGGSAATIDIHRCLPRFKRGAPDAPQMAVKRTPRGYDVELYVPRSALGKANLTPGRIIAFNFSINNGQDCYLRWTENLGRNISFAPSLWGDLLLLGTDADLSLFKLGTTNRLETLLPGEPLGVRVKDRDMNMDDKVRDRIRVEIQAQNGDRVDGVLEETGVKTGVFEGGIDTDLFVAADYGAEQIGDRVLQMHGGEILTARYLDQARRYGERNFFVTARISVGLPVMSFQAGP